MAILGIVPGVEELEDSPTFDFSRKKSSATMTLKCPWNQITRLVQTVFPPSFIRGRTVVIPPAETFPGIPWLVAQSAKVTPLFGNTIQHNPNVLPSTYPYAKVVLDFSTAEYDQVKGATGSGSGPGGKQGSGTETLVSHKVTTGGEFLTYPAGGLEWALPDDMSLFRCAPEKAILSKRKRANGDVNAGVIIPTIEHHITWHFVAFPPWNAIRQLMGHVNAYPFAGAPQETVLFMGAEASIEVNTGGTQAWTMGYKFSEKNNNALNLTAPFGWNHFLRPGGSNAGNWQRLARRINAPSTQITGTKIGSNDLEMEVKDGTAFPFCGDFLVQIGLEQMRVAGNIRGSNNWTIAERGVNGTTQDAHSVGDSIQQVYAAPLAAPMTADQTILYLRFDWNFPITGSQYTVFVNGESMLVVGTGSYRAASGNIYTSLTVLRGADGTTAAAHATGDLVGIGGGSIYPNGDFTALFLSGLAAG